MQYELRVEEGPNQGRSILLEVGRALTIGRVALAEFGWRIDQRMSREHFEIQADEHVCRIRDLGSTNGTYVNGGTINDWCELDDGDYVIAGQLEVSINAVDQTRLRADTVPSMPLIACVVAERPAECPRIDVQSRTCVSGLTRVAGKAADMDASELARFLAAESRCFLLLDPHKAECDFDPPDQVDGVEVRTPEFLFDQLNRETAEAMSPLIKETRNSLELERLFDQSLGRNGLIAFFVHPDHDEFVAQLRSVCAGGDPAETQQISGLCWPVILTPWLTHSSADAVAGLMEHVDAVLMEQPGDPTTWQLYGTEDLHRRIERIATVNGSNRALSRS